MSKLREEFENSLSLEMLGKYNWCDDEHTYKPVESTPFDYGGDQLKADSLTVNFMSFVEGYKAATESEDKEIAELKAASEWISVDDELPPYDVMILVNSNYGTTVGSRSSWSGKIQDHVSGNDDGMINMEGEAFKPTHWMPLPEPPK